MVATVRNRRGVLVGVRPFDGNDGRLHLVDIEYNDGDSPRAESLLWEREPHRHLVPPSALPQLEGSDPMSGEDLLAMVRACRWSARMPYIDPDGAGPVDRLPISAPFHGAVQIEDYQLVPLLKALRMPRASLLIADDVGIGKTVEAGLIVQELLLRRRIRRVMILTPASLRLQWKDEMWQKFSLPFDVVDRESTQKLRRDLGMDANPWRSHARVIASYHYLKQSDVLEQLRAASQPDQGGAHLPWDLLIVDEAHNLTPPPFGEDSDLCAMLRQVAPLFEHRIFLTATPHNGHTRSFTGLLEMLDPVRFTQSAELKDAERKRVEDVVVRRLKREINARSNPKRFCDRLPPESLLLDLDRGEKMLMDAFGEFRARVRKLVAAEGKKRRLAGNFAIEILGKRLLSCPVAFADSWLRVRAGLSEDAETTDAEVLASQRSVEEESTDDREAESRRRAASTVIGAWLRPLADKLHDEAAGLDAALKHLNLDQPASNSDSDESRYAAKPPREDVRYDALRRLIESRLRSADAWSEDERLVVFTEYKTTLDYVLGRLRRDFRDDSRFACLYGGMDDAEREVMKRAFNDPDSPVRVLVATDAASEGLNLQETARYLLHWDVPWNPARLEQRNGRIDRHGQGRDVTVWHFMSNEEQDLAFLGLIVRKVDAIREDLGATGEVFDELTHRRLIEGESLEAVRRDLESRVDAAVKAADVPRDQTIAVNGAEGLTDPAADLDAIRAELDLDPEALRVTLDAAMAISAGRPRITAPDDRGRCRIVNPPPASWSAVIDDAVRIAAPGRALGAIPSLAFDAAHFIDLIGGRPIFRCRKDTLLLHLGHPMLQRALTVLTRQRFPGAGKGEVSRWTVRHAAAGEMPKGADAMMLLSVEELAVNELRETFHHWLRTVRFPVRDGQLSEPLPHVPACALSTPASDPLDEALVDAARDVWSEIEVDCKRWTTSAIAELTARLAEQLERERTAALDQENERYQSRQAEVSTLIASSTLQRLEKEIEAMKIDRRQGKLFASADDLDRLDRDIAMREEELERRRGHYEGVRRQLQSERERIVRNLIPKRHTMRGQAQVLPVAIELVLPAAPSQSPAR